MDRKVQSLLAGEFPLPARVLPVEKKAGDGRGKPSQIDQRLREPINFGTTVQEIAKGFAERMAKINAPNCPLNDKFLMLGAHIFGCVADCLDRCLLQPDSPILAQDRSFIQSVSRELKELATNVPHPNAVPVGFQEYWRTGTDVSKNLSAHAAHMARRQ